MTSAEKLAILRSLRMGDFGDRVNSVKVAKAALDYGIACAEAVQSCRTLSPSELTEPGLYLAKTTTGEVIALRVMAHEIEKGTVFMGLTYQGPLVWEDVDIISDIDNN
jgi:hypothetical protein